MAETKKEKGMENTATEVFSPAELAGFLGCKRTKVYELLRTGEIPSYRVGRLRRVVRSDAERWREEAKKAEQKKK